MAEFTFYNNSYFRNEDGKLIPVTDPDTLKALKANQLPHKVEPMGRSLTFAEQTKGTQVSAKPSPYAVAGGGIEQPASTSLPGQGDVKSTFNSLLQNALKSFAGASNVEELRARKDSLIARQMVAPTSAPGMETRPDFGTNLISNRGAEFGGALDILDTEISKAKAGDAASKANLTDLMALGEKLGYLGAGPKKDTSVQEVAGKKVLIDNQTGEVIRTLGSTTSTMTTGTGVDNLPISSTAKNYITLIEAGTLTLEEAMTKIGSSKAGLALKNEVVSGIAQSGGRTQQSIDKLKEIQAAIKDIKEGDFEYFGASIAPRTMYGIGGLNPYYKAFQAKVDNLVAMLSLDNLPLLKGPMSDKDIEFIKQMSSGLDIKMDEKSAGERLDKIFKKVTDKLNLIPEVAQTSSGKLTSPDGTQEVDISQLTPAELKEAKTAGWQ